ncbi:Lyso-phosphatidylcholine acyltransferase [Neofusicoccum ribis]|uniref:Tafazzin family protein n=1 Tax=Neofusicoccum ribis TaxID=45134 RepID=A0ABR3SMX4_9PEZI
MGVVGLASRGFLAGLSNLEVNGMDGFFKLLDERKDVQGRQRGLITAIRLLSRAPFAPPHRRQRSSQSIDPDDIPDPFTSAALTYTTTGRDAFPAPAAYLSRRHAWVHIFPEGKVHQKEDRTMRYFKWGVARLILESEPCPDVVPIWVEGPEQIMHEAREFPRFLPRPGKTVNVTFGERVDVEKVFGDLRERWRRLRDKDGGSEGLEVGVLSEGLKHGKEAVELRKECTMRVREEVLKVRRSRGLPDEDPKAGLVETWALEGGKQEGKMDDESWVKDT